MENYIIECPLAEVFINDVSQGFHNEYTCRNLQLAVRRGELENVRIVFDGKSSIVKEDGRIDSRDLKGFYDVSYNLVFNMLD